MMKIFVHTLGRASDYGQQTLHRLGPWALERTAVVVQGHEVLERPAAGRYYQGLGEKLGVEILYLPDEIRMLSPTRQWIMDYAADSGIDKAFLLDDDLAFYVRKSPDDWHLRYAQGDDVRRLFETLSGWLDEVVHVGVSAREGNNRIGDVYVECTRAMRVLGYDVAAFRKLGIRFDRIEAKQDFDATLQLLRLGLENRVSYEFAQGQWRGSNETGGCSAYRDDAMLRRSSEQLAALHPGFVRVVEKRTKGAWGGGARTDVIVMWKRAFMSAPKRKPS